MENYFEYFGGMRQVSAHETEKFLVFPIVAGKEVSIYNLINNGIVKTMPDGERPIPKTPGIRNDHVKSFISPFDEMKIFIFNSGFGVRRQFYSLYLKFVEPPAPVVTIKSVVADSFYLFRGYCRFLKNHEVLSILSKEDPSYGFVQRAEPIPINFIKNYIHVDKAPTRMGLRKLRF